MTRPVGTLTAAAVASAEVYTCVLLEMLFTPDPLRVWTGIGDFVWGDKTFTGAGDLLGVSTAEETSETRSVALTVSLSAIPTEIIDHALAADYRGKMGTMWVAVTDAGNRFLDQPVKYYSGRMDVMTWSEGETATISLTIESELADLDRPRIRRYTDRDQQAEYPGDLGFQFVDMLQNTSIKWGQGINS